MNKELEQINERLSYANRKMDFDLNNRSIWVSSSYPLFLLLIFLLADLHQSWPLFFWGFWLSISLISFLQWLHHNRSHFLYLISRQIWFATFLTLYFLQASLLVALLVISIYVPSLKATNLLLMPIILSLSTVSVYCLLPRFWIAVIYSSIIFLPLVTTLVIEKNYTQAIVFGCYFLFVLIMARLFSREYIRGYKVEMQLESEGLALERRSQIDPLTQIYNRGYFNTSYNFQWNLSLRNKKEQSLLILDIDHFKLVNDTHGHLVGDQCLIDVANIIRRVAKRKTDLVARFGGEEFVVLLINTSLDEAEKVAESIRQQIEDNDFIYDDSKLDITISIGIACLIPNASVSPDELVAQADKALYEAKKSGRNRVCRYSKN